MDEARGWRSKREPCTNAVSSSFMITDSSVSPSFGAVNLTNSMLLLFEFVNLALEFYFPRSSSLSISGQSGCGVSFNVLSSLSTWLDSRARSFFAISSSCYGKLIWRRLLYWGNSIAVRAWNELPSTHLTFDFVNYISLNIYRNTMIMSSALITYKTSLGLDSTNLTIRWAIFRCEITILPIIRCINEAMFVYNEYEGCREFSVRERECVWLCVCGCRSEWESLGMCDRLCVFVWLYLCDCEWESVCRLLEIFCACESADY